MRKSIAEGSLFPLMFEFGRLVRRKTAVVNHDTCVTLPQLEALHVISEAKEPLMRDVARALRITAPSATALIEELAAAGLLERRTNSLDRREVRVHLTSRGKRMLRTLVGRKERALAEILSVLSQKEHADFMSIIDTIVKANKK